jgi:hypothetical protein
MTENGNKYSEAEHNKKVANAEKPAYPTNARMHSDAQGMTKRELFAMAAMQGLLANSHYLQRLEENFDDDQFDDMNVMLVKESVEIADELLKALES